jgi:hypothetical protein
MYHAAMRLAAFIFFSFYYLFIHAAMRLAAFIFFLFIIRFIHAAMRLAAFTDRPLLCSILV